MSAAGSAGEPRIHAPLQHIQRQCARIEDLIMKSAKVEFRAERNFRARTQLEQLQLSDLVRQCL